MSYFSMDQPLPPWINQELDNAMASTKRDCHCCASDEDSQKAVSECLQQMLKVLEEEEEIVNMATQNQNPTTPNNIPASFCMEQDDEELEIAVIENKGESETNSQNPPTTVVVSVCQPMMDLNLQSLLPHEGPRWIRLRDKMATEPQFKEYANRVHLEDAQWSLDEAFISFCLDRVEEVLAGPLPAPAQQRPAIVNQKTKKTTRRKGQPRKYERVLNDNSASIEAETNLYADTRFVMEPFEDEVNEEEDALSMDDNPDDLDYTPLSIIRYKKTPSRRMPRRNSSRGSRDEITIVPIEIMNDDNSSVVIEHIPKQSKPKRRAQSGKAAKTKPEQGPPRKRGRPRKNPADLAKNKRKKGRPRMTEEQKIEKKKAYNESRTRLRLEVLRDTLPRIFRCKMCVEQFTETENMILHHFDVHMQQSISEQDREDKTSAYNTCRLADIAAVLRECPDCKEYVENIKTHSRKHRPRNIICEECGKLFLTCKRLNIHMRVHRMDRTGERLQCDKCDNSYRCIASLQRHQLLHAGKKTFICDQCGKDFFNSVRLRVHRAVHMKEKPYKCTECGRGFTQLTNLRSHERVHTGIKPYKCDHCQDSFTHKVSMKMHQKKKHGIDWWKENGVQMQDRKPVKKRSAAMKKLVDQELARMDTFVDQHHTHPEEVTQSYQYASNLIMHGSKTYAQLERKTNVTESFQSMMNPFEHPWHS